VDERVREALKIVEEWAREKQVLAIEFYGDHIEMQGQPYHDDGDFFRFKIRHDLPSTAEAWEDND
jgi:hypothetical protein